MSLGRGTKLLDSLGEPGRGGRGKAGNRGKLTAVLQSGGAMTEFAKAELTEAGVYSVSLQTFM